MTAVLPAIAPSCEIERVWLDESSWVDVGRGWLSNSNEVHEHLHDNVEWRTSRLYRYDHWVEERRLGSMWRRGMPLPHPSLAQVHRALEQRYSVGFDGFGLIHYRNGADGQAFHRDTDMRWLDDTVVAILTLGAQRPWLLRPRGNRHSLAETRGATHDLAPACGDLIVMGGRCQADWEHSVAYLRSRVGPRISLQWRFAHRRGKPFIGSSYRAPVQYSR